MIVVSAVAAPMMPQCHRQRYRQRDRGGAAILRAIMRETGDDALAQHLATLQERYAAALAASGYDALILGAGCEEHYFLDDQGPPFRPNPCLAQWFPAAAHPGACLAWRPGEHPVAVLLQIEDYWRLPPEPPGTPWDRHIEFRFVREPDEIESALPAWPGRVARVGPPGQWPDAAASADLNPPALLDALHYPRAVKTDWEVARIRDATRAAVAGHRAVASAFADGASEFEMLLAFQSAARQTAAELPYPAIIAGDRNAATLHYQHYRRDAAPARSLLVDAGCQSLGYASDITRGYARPAEPEFARLIAGLERLQQALCKRVAPGLPFARLHHAAHVLLGQLLEREGLVRAPAEAIVATGVTRLFFPHGLGHLLGLQVHDVGGQLASADGRRLKPPEVYPKLRLLRELAPGFVLTIEPGLYFIDSLLRELRRHELGPRVDWSRIERLRDCGGIRIEDNLLVTGDGAINLTREAFAAADEAD